MKLLNKLLKSNKGLSLLELVVAVCFLAIVITPVMNSFITAGKINAKSRKLMCANDCAQSIMEGIADKSFYELKLAFLNEYGTNDVSANFALSGLDGGVFNKAVSDGNVDDTNVVISGGFTLTDASLTDITQHSLKFIPTGGAGVSYNTASSISDNSFVQTINSVFRQECKSKLGAVSTDLNKHLCVWKNSDVIDNLYVMMLCYSGIEWDGYYFDAVVTFIPTARVPGVGADEDLWYSYYVQIDMYDLERSGSEYIRTLGYDETDADTVSPVLSLNTGIKHN